MLFRVFAKKELENLFELLSYSYLIGPTQKAVSSSGEIIYGFEHLEMFEQLAFRYSTTAHSAKKYFLPHLQTLVSYTLDDHSWQKEVNLSNTTPAVFFGMHACDINGLNRLDRILLGGRYPNPFYSARRLHTFIVGVDCTPTSQCFCKSMGCDRVLHGCDMFLTDIGEDYLCEIRSAAAFEVMKGVVSREADHHDHSLFVKSRAARDQMFSCQVETADLIQILDMEFEAEAWVEWGRLCLSCGTCANVCPTCYCYGTEHLVDLHLKRAHKDMRLYSCNIVDFAEVADGRNFRPHSENRIKYRYYHKHRGFVEAYEESLCVGCGRCGRACLAGITVPKVISSIRKEAATHG